MVGYPFGTAVDQALQKALEAAAGLRLRTQYWDGGYYGYAEIGEGSEKMDILGHLAEKGVLQLRLEGSETMLACRPLRSWYFLTWKGPYNELNTR